MRKKILVVDDEPDIRFTLRTLLSAKGYEVDDAEDGQVALEKIKSESFDLLILDLLMPNVSGYEVIGQLSLDGLSDMPVVLLTAKGEDKDIMNGYSMGATYYITKPFKNRRVLDITEYLIGRLDPAQKQTVEARL